MKLSTPGDCLFPDRMTKRRVTVSLGQNAPGCVQPGRPVLLSPGLKAMRKSPGRNGGKEPTFPSFPGRRTPLPHDLPLSIPSLYSCDPSPSHTQGLILRSNPTAVSIYLPSSPCFLDSSVGPLGLYLDPHIIPSELRGSWEVNLQTWTTLSQ